MSDDADRAAWFEEMFIKEGIANAVEKLEEPAQTFEGGVMVCACCGDPIPPERLEKVPNTTLCVECKSLLE